jgi:hypothetical protein
MKFGSLGKKALVGGAVSLGTAGLSNCGSGGVVDPPPPPLTCTELDFLRDLGASVTAGSGSFLVRIAYVGRQSATWRTLPGVTQLEGATLREVRRGGDLNLDVIVELVPASPLPARISFVLEGALASASGTAGTCLFQRGFTILPEGPSIADSRPALPFDTQAFAAIVVTHREGREVGLRAEVQPAGRSIVWTVTGGRFRTRGDGIVWTLPAEAGLYQAELLVDHGEDGFAFDALTLEVHRA